MIMLYSKTHGIDEYKVGWLWQFMMANRNIKSDKDLQTNKEAWRDLNQIIHMVGSARQAEEQFQGVV